MSTGLKSAKSSVSEATERRQSTYQQPSLFLVGSTTDLIQGCAKGEKCDGDCGFVKKKER